MQGGPGTGKTVVGLHRVSWLLFNRRERLDARDVLMVGPNPAFVRYIACGAALARRRGRRAAAAVQALGPRVRIGRVDPPEVRRLKGDRRLLRLILRGLRNRQRVEASPVELAVEGRTGRARRPPHRHPGPPAGRPAAQRGLPHAAGLPRRRGRCRALGRPGPGGEPAAGRGARARSTTTSPGSGPASRPRRSSSSCSRRGRQLLAAGAGTLSESELDLLALPSDARSPPGSGRSTTSRCSTRPPPCSTGWRRRTTTSWSTRPRTCRRCSSNRSAGDHGPGR